MKALHTLSLRDARSALGSEWCRDNDWPLHPKQVMSQEEFAQAVIRVANIQAKREAAGLLFMRTFKWPAVPNGSEDEKDELRRAKLPEILKKYLKPDGHYTL